MFSFSIDLTNIIVTSYDKECLFNDYELMKSCNSDTIEIINNHSTSTHECISFKLNLKFEMEIDNNIRDIITSLKLTQLISEKDNLAYLPYWIKFDFNGNILNVSGSVFWMKKKLTEIKAFQDSYSTGLIEEIKESIFFSISENFKSIIQFPDKKVLLNWLQEMKEENVIKFSDDIPIDNIIFQQTKNFEKLNFDSSEEEDTNLGLLKARSDKLAFQKKNKYKKVEDVSNPNTIVDYKSYNKFFEEGGVVGEIITDRGSTFQSHAIKITNFKNIQNYLNLLKTNNKIIKATHNILAYRFSEKKQGQKESSITEGFDDDGEDGAGIRLLGILQKMKVCNVMVVVSRWFGGTFLGNDRFKHINDSAKNLILSYKNNYEFLP